MQEAVLEVTHQKILLLELSKHFKVQHPRSKEDDDEGTSIAEGVVEVWLTSEDLGAYGHDIGVTLPELLEKLVCIIPEGCMMRLGMTNPPYIMEHMEASHQCHNNNC